MRNFDSRQLLIIVIAVQAAIITGRGSEQRVISASELRIVDESGSVRLALGLGADDNTPGVRIYDRGGRLRAALEVCVVPSGIEGTEFANPRLLLADQHGESTILLQHRDGSHHGDNQELVFLRGSRTSIRLGTSASFDASGSGELKFLSDEGGVVELLAGQFGKKPSLILRSQQPEASGVIYAGFNNGDYPASLVVKHNESEIRQVIDQLGGPLLSFVDKEGQVRVVR